jgi:hypothetical protein
MGVFGWMERSVIASGYGSRLCADITGVNATIEIERTALIAKLDLRFSIHNQQKTSWGERTKWQVGMRRPP